jgi:formylglycine-generating enzyme required for sulfatase activity
VLIENRSLEQVPERHRPKVDRIRQWLTCTLRYGALPPIDRAQAGDALAVIGDPRFRADAWYLPDEALLGFVEIPAGSFLMGSDATRDPEAEESEKPQHPLILPRFFIGRYPVTVAQFQAFVEASGQQPDHEDSLHGLSTHPVVYVTWYDARRYGDWLTEQLRAWEATPEPLASLLRREGWMVTLPSEAEWEKAARGTEGRIYPWGDEPDAHRANYADTRIHATSAVGCFPGGASAYGAEELSGNVWEWTRSVGDACPYPTRQEGVAARENLDAPDDASRVWRGGAFDLYHGSVRCASRLGLYPGGWSWGIGCRVVVRPCR